MVWKIEKNLGATFLQFCILVHLVPQIQNQLKPYADALIQGMPPKLKLPFYQYGSQGNVMCRLALYLIFLSRGLVYKWYKKIPCNITKCNSFENKKC